MRRWGRYDAPIMVCVELDEAGQNGKVVNVVLGDEHDDVALARDHRGHFLVYDDAMQRIRTDEGTEGRAINIAEYREWPDRHDWGEGPDALRYPGLYDAIEPDHDTEYDHDLDTLDPEEREPTLYQQLTRTPSPPA